MKEKIALALFAVTALLTLTLSVSPLPDAQDRLHALPRSGLDFTSRELPLSPAEATVLGKAKVIKRLYQVRDQHVVMMVIDGGSNRHAVHDPAYCFRGAGWTVRARRPFPLEGGSAALLTLARGAGEEQEAMYWISDDRDRYYAAMALLVGDDPAAVDVWPLGAGAGDGPVATGSRRAVRLAAAGGQFPGDAQFLESGRVLNSSRVNWPMRAANAGYCFCNSSR